MADVEKQNQIHNTGGINNTGAGINNRQGAVREPATFGAGPERQAIYQSQGPANGLRKIANPAPL